MAPEQAKGRAVDKRADIWAFGCVLYEMLTGRRAFGGDDVAETLATVLKTDPDWTNVPPAAAPLIRSCLEKDPKRRLRDIGDAWRLFEQPQIARPVLPARRPWLAWGVATALLVATIVVSTLHFREQPPVPELVRFQISAPDKTNFDTYIALSPDGRHVVFRARDVSGIVRLWIRDLDSVESRPLKGTEEAWGPFWSPDSRYVGFSVDRELKKIDASGASPVPIMGLALSPDASRAAVVRSPTTSVAGDADIWLAELARGVTTRFTFTTAREDSPVWSPDGRRIAFRSNRNGTFDLFERAANGAGDDALIHETKLSERPTGWSSDGRFLLYEVATGPSSSAFADIWVTGMDADRTTASLVQTPFNEGQARFAPNGRWMAYVSNESGRNEIYVRAFSESASDARVAAKGQVSRDGGANPKWRGDGKELYFRGADGSLMAVDVQTASGFQAGIPQRLFPLPPNAGNWDVAADGKRFLVAVQQQDSSSTAITVVLNWRAAIGR